MLDLLARVSRIGNTSLTLEVAIYPQDDGATSAPMTTIEAIYVGFHADTGETRPVPDAIRTLVDTYESTGTILPLSEFPELAAAQTDG
jgi:acyl-CoA thioesterase FadM